MLITGHKTESIFERYNINTADAEAALMKSRAVQQRESCGYSLGTIDFYSGAIV